MNNYFKYNKFSHTNNYIDNYNSNQLYDPYEGFIRGNMFPSLYSEYKLAAPLNLEPLSEQATLLTYIDAYFFAGHDLKLFLDNFPDNKSMNEKFKEFRQNYDLVIKEYESRYGPLLIDSDFVSDSKWNWINEPWPWDN